MPRLGFGYGIRGLLACVLATNVLLLWSLGASAAPPQITSTPPSEARIGEAYSYQVQASDPDGTPLTYSLSVFTPQLSGISVSASGLVTWNPSSREQAGEAGYRINVRDGNDEGAEQYVWFPVIDPDNQSPVVNNTPATVAYVGQPYIFDLQASDAEGDALSYSFFSWPQSPGKQLSSDGIFTWTPTVEDAADEHWISISVRDSLGALTKVEFTVEVVASDNHSPEFISTPPTQAQVGELYVYNFAATDPDGDTLSYELIDTRPEITLDPIAQRLQWVPSEVTDAEGEGIKIIARDIYGGLAWQIFYVHVAPADTPNNTAPVAQSASYTIDEDTTLPLTLLAFDAEGDALTYHVTPPSVGALTGSAPNLTYVPPVNYFGEVSFSFYVDDSELSSGVGEISIVISPINDRPEAFSQSTSTMENVPLQIVLEGRDTEGDPLTFIVQSPQFGVVSGLAPNLVYTPSLNFHGRDSFVFSVSDGVLESESAVVLIDIENINGAPRIVSTAATEVAERDQFTYVIQAEDVDGDNIDYLGRRTPYGASVEHISGMVYWYADDRFVQSVDVQNPGCLAEPQDISNFSAMTRWHWRAPSVNRAAFNVMGPVLVGQFSDDNADGAIDSLDNPDLVFISYQTGQNRGILNVVDGASGVEIWSTFWDSSIAHLAIPAIGDIDADGLNEIIVATEPNVRLLAFEHSGELKWSTQTIENSSVSTDAIAVSDIDLDGDIEIIFRNRVFNSEGVGLWVGSNDIGGNILTGSSLSAPMVADVNLDGRNELVSGRSLYRDDGALIWHQSSIPSDGFNAVGNFDDDMFAEIVLVANGNVYLLDHLGAVIWGPFAIPGGGAGGPPVVADMDGDGQVEIGVAGAQNYVVFETSGEVRWSSPTEDLSSNRTGSSVFDFNGDGRVEILYADERYFRIYDGYGGEVLYELLNYSSTRLEYPIVADVDQDGSAEIILGSGSTGFAGIDATLTGGVRVLESAGNPWVGTRSIWNQHSYNILNVNDDGTIPRVANTGWLSHNTFRLNTFANRDPMALADLRVGAILFAEDQRIVSAEVSNLGAYTAQAGVIVSFVLRNESGEQRLLGEQVLPSLAVGERARVELPLGDTDFSGEISITVNDLRAIGECNYENNVASAPIFTVSAIDPWGLEDLQTFVVNVIDQNDVPEIQLPSIYPVLVGDVFQYQPIYFDRDVGDHLTFSLVGAPSEMAVSRSGRIEWLTTESDVGEHAFEIRVDDLRGGSASAQVTVQVDPLPSPNRRPEILSLPVESVIEGDNYQYQVLASDPDGDSLFYAINTNSADLSINSQTGLISGVITSLNDISVVVTVSDQQLSTQQNFVIAVIDRQSTLPPEIQSVPQTLAQVVGGYEYIVEATVPATFILDVGPEGASLDDNVLSWTHANENFVSDNIALSSCADTSEYVVGEFGSASLFVESNHDPVRFPRLETPLWPNLLDVSDIDTQIALGIMGRDLAGEGWSFSQTLNWTTTPPGWEGFMTRLVVSGAEGAALGFNRGVYGYSIPLDTSLEHRALGFHNDTDSIRLSHESCESPDNFGVIVGLANFDWERCMYDNWGRYGVTTAGAPVRRLQSDLAVVAAQVLPSGLVSVEVINRGLVESSPFNVNFYEQSDSSQEMLGFRSLPALASNQSVRVELSPQSAIQGDIRVSVEPEGGQECRNENNSVNLEYFRIRAVNVNGSSEPQEFWVRSRDNRLALISYIPERIYAGVEYSANLQVSPVEANASIVVINAPSGMHIEGNSRLVWQTTDLDVGTHPIQLSIADPILGTITVEAQIQVLAIPDNQPPQVVSTPPIQAIVGQEYVYQMSVVDIDGDAVSLVGVSVPSGPQTAQVDENFRLTWIPSVQDFNWVTPRGGYSTLQVDIRDSRGLGSIHSVPIQLSMPDNPSHLPQVAPVPYAVVGVGESYTVQVSATNSSGLPLDYVLTEGPELLQISPLGELSWAPQEANLGLNLVTVAVTNENGTVSTSHYVNVVNTFRIINTPPTSVQLGNTYEFQVQTSSPAAEYLLTTAPSGMSVDSNGAVVWIPTEGQIGAHSVVLEARDAQQNRSTVSFIVVVFDVQAPLSATLSISPSEAYLGSSVSLDLAIENALPALTVTALVNGEPVALDSSYNATIITTVLGVNPIEVVVNDGRGDLRLTGSFMVRERPNTAPVLTGLTPLVATSGQAYVGQVQASDSDGHALSYVLLNSPVGMSINSLTGVVSWTPTVAQVGSHTVNVRVSDGQLTDEATFTLLVDSVPVETLLVAAAISPMEPVLDDSVVLQITTAHAQGNVLLAATLNGTTPLAIDGFGQATFVASQAGVNRIEITATDDATSASQTLTFLVRDPSDTTPPTATFHAPITGSVLNAPADVVVTVNDDNLVAYRVLYKRTSATEWRELVSGSSNVTQQSVAVLDPSLLLNGQYTLALEARDVNDRTTTDTVIVSVEGDLKVGNFSFTVQDLSIPLVGIPIEISRTYDSRRRDELLDFGYGWSIDYQNVLLDESRVLGEGWQLTTQGFNHCVRPMGSPIVTVTLPDGDVEKFSVTASPECSFGVPTLDVSFTFTPVGDTQSSLSALDWPGGRLVASRQRLEILGEERAVDPNLYQLTTRAGYVYTIHQTEGIRTVIDPNGHTLTYSENGIVHSSGKAVTFVRNSEGLIEEIIDPNNSRLVYTRDANNDLRVFTDRDTTQTTYTYNSGHGLIDILDPYTRRVLRNIYDDNGRLIAQEDQNGVRKSFDHNLSERSSVITDLDGRTTAFNYDDRGNVLEEIKVIRDGSYSADIVTTFTYDANDNRTSKTINGLTWTTPYDANNNLTQSCNPLNECVQYSDYNARGQEGRITDERGNAYVMHYDAVGNLQRVDSPQINDPITGEPVTPSATNIINSLGQVTSTTDLRGLVTTYTYYTSGPAAGQKHTESNPVSGTMTYTYDANNNVLTETRQRSVNGSVVSETTTHTYDARDRRTRSTFDDGTYTETVYDLAGNVDRERDRFGNWTDFSYDAYGRLTETVYADGSRESRSYTREGLLETVTDTLGRVTRNEYDDAGRLWRVHHEASGTFTETRYNAQGWVLEEFDANRNRTEYRYDDAGRRIEVIRHLGEGSTQRHQFSHYPNGELLSETDALDRSTTYLLNALDQRVATQFVNGTEQRDSFDVMGSRIASTDTEGRRTRYRYDALGRLLGVTPEVSIDGNPVPETTYTYDQVGNKLSQTDANGHTTRWTYDLHGRVLSRTLPQGQVETFTYTDGQGCAPSAGANCASAASPRLLVHTDFNGDSITTAFDVMGRSISVSYSKDSSSEIFSYYANGQVHTVTDQHGTTTYSYDSRDRLTRELQPDGTQLDYAYDDVGNRTLVSITRSGSVSSSTEYTYDALNRLETSFDTATPSQITQYTYDAVGNLNLVVYPNGLITDYDYNNVNQLTDVYTRDVFNTVLNHFHYTLSPSGRRQVISELDGRTSAYCYDALYRLTREAIFDSVASPISDSCTVDTSTASHQASYQYDWVGNRTYEIVNGVHTAYSYDDNDRLQQHGGTLYSYDNNGNTLSETLDGVTKTYIWDAKNKLSQVTQGASTTEYAYNHSGIRVSKTEAGTSTRYVVDSNRDYAQVLEEVSGGSAQVRYSYGHDLISQERGGAKSFYHYDGLGSTRALSDATGSVTDTYAYEAFGNVLEQTGETENSYLFTGEQFDSSLNQYYLRARYYDQGVGRFTQMDTWMGNNQDPITLHKYLYANVDPVMYTDPTGNFSIGSMMSTVNTMASLTLRAYNTYSNVTLLMDIAQGNVTLTELALNYAIGKFLPRSFFRCRNSFSGDTLVLSEYGPVPISEIAIGDRVWSYDESSGDVSLEEVIHLVSGEGIKELSDIEIQSGEFITATSDHTFYIPSESDWVEAGELTDGVGLLQINGENLAVKAVIPYKKDAVVYNLSVANNHNYYVGKSGVLAHNCYQKPNWQVYQNGKHIAPRGLTQREVRDRTQNGPAKYYLNSARDVKEFELNAWKKGIPLKNNPTYKIVEHPEVIGAKYGRDSRWQRLEYDQTSDTIHGHPITKEEFDRYMRDAAI